MDDELLQRARALSQAANTAAAGLSAMNIGNVNLGGAEEAPSTGTESLTSAGSPARAVPHKPSNEVVRAEFKVAAINGSSLLTTYGDIRPFAQRKSEIVIDGIKYRIAERGEYSGSRVQLSQDFHGSTNLEATLQIMGKAKSGASGGSAEKRGKARLLRDDVDLGAANAAATRVGNDLDDLMVSLRPQQGQQQQQQQQQQRVVARRRQSTSAGAKRREMHAGAGTGAGDDAPKDTRPTAVAERHRSRKGSDPSLMIPVSAARPSPPAAVERGRIVGFGRAEGKAHDAKQQGHQQYGAPKPKVEDAVAMQSRVEALERVKQKKKQDQEKARRDELERENVALRKKVEMQEKAEALRAATEERVAKMKLEKRTSELLARKRHEQEEKMKEERRRSAQSDAARERARRLKIETRERLKRTNLLAHKAELEAEQETERKLQERARERARTEALYNKTRAGSARQAEGDARSVHSAKSQRSTRTPDRVHHSDSRPTSRSPRSRPGSDVKSLPGSCRLTRDPSPVMAGAPPPLPAELHTRFPSSPPRGRLEREFNAASDSDSDSDVHDAGAGIVYSARAAPERTNAAARRVAEDVDTPEYGDPGKDKHASNYLNVHEHTGYDGMGVFDLSMDSIDREDRISALPEFAPRTRQDMDAISTTSSLTMDDTFYSASVRDEVSSKHAGSSPAAAAVSKAPARKQGGAGGSKVPIWKKLKPIETTAYKPVPKKYS